MNRRHRYRRRRQRRLQLINTYQAHKWTMQKCDFQTNELLLRLSISKIDGRKMRWIVKNGEKNGQRENCKTHWRIYSPFIYISFLVSCHKCVFITHWPKNGLPGIDGSKDRKHVRGRDWENEKINRRLSHSKIEIERLEIPLWRRKPSTISIISLMLENTFSAWNNRLAELWIWVWFFFRNFTLRFHLFLFMIERRRSGLAMIENSCNGKNSLNFDDFGTASRFDIGFVFIMFNWIWMLPSWIWKKSNRRKKKTERVIYFLAWKKATLFGTIKGSNSRWFLVFECTYDNWRAYIISRKD